MDLILARIPGALQKFVVLNQKHQSLGFVFKNSKYWVAWLPNGKSFLGFKSKEKAAEALADYRVFSGFNSEELWKVINAVQDLQAGASDHEQVSELASNTHNALYLLGCKLQELEEIIRKR